MANKQFHDQIISELESAGVSNHNLHKNVIKVLVDVMREGEHIYGAIVGRNVNRWSSMLVATNKRVIYIEADILFHSYDEVAYGAVSGISVRPTPIFTSITLFTKVHDYTINMLQKQAAIAFRKVVEDLLTHAGDITQDTPSVSVAHLGVAPANTAAPAQSVSPTSAQKAFLSTADSAVLATASRTGEVLAVPVYIAHLGDDLYVFTREKTKKSRNMSGQKPIALTAFDSKSHQYVQLQGYATQKNDSQLIREAYDAIVTLIPNTAPLQAPLRDSSLGEYTVFKIEPTHITSNLT